MKEKIQYWLSCCIYDMSERKENLGLRYGLVHPAFSKIFYGKEKNGRREARKFQNNFLIQKWSKTYVISELQFFFPCRKMSEDVKRSLHVSFSLPNFFIKKNLIKKILKKFSDMEERKNKVNCVCIHAFVIGILACIWNTAEVFDIRRCCGFSKFYPQ